MWTLLAIAAGALTTFGLLALGHEYARARKNFEATTTDEPEHSEASTWSRRGENFQVVARRERPNRCGTEEGHELASFQLIELHLTLKRARTASQNTREMSG
jgi:hypothetical protein